MVSQEEYNIYKSSTGPTDFIAKMSKLNGMSKGTANNHYYKMKAGKITLSDAAPVQSAPRQAVPQEQVQEMAQPQQLQPQATTNQSPPQVTVIKPSDVKVEAEPLNIEAQEINDTYKKMLEQQTGDIGVHPGAAQTPPLGPGPDATVNGDLEQKTKAMTIKLYKMLATLGVSLNDNLFWKGDNRELSNEEKSTIDEFSKDMQTVYAPNMNDPNAPIFNWLTAVVVLPAVARIDLIPKKMDGVAKWLQNMRSSATQPQGQQQQAQRLIPEQTTPPPTVQGGPEPVVDKKPAGPDMTGWSDAQKAWINGAMLEGKQVSPNFKPLEPMDVEAMRNGIIKNFGDKYNG